VIVLLACACVERGRDAAVTVRDSAGVIVVESHGPLWDDTVGWSVAAEPVLEVGTAAGAPEYELSQVEDAVRLPDRRIVVADGGSQQLRAFDAEGRFLGAAGGRGDGPGEFRLINDIGYGPGDSVWVYDFGTRRFTILTDSLRLVRTMTLGSELSSIGSVGRLADGSFIVREYWSTGSEIRSGLTRDPAAVARYAPQSSLPDTVGLFPGREVFIGSEAGRAVMSAPLFARNLSAAVRGNEVIIGDQVRFELGVYTASGALLRIVRVPDVDLHLGAADLDAEIRARLAREQPDRRQRLRAHLEAMEAPATRPAYGRILVDRPGHIWVAEYSGALDEPRSWRVFDAEGRLLGRVALPARFRLHDIGDDWLLGTWRDELDVERVRLYRLRKG